MHLLTSDHDCLSVDRICRQVVTNYPEEEEVYVH